MIDRYIKITHIYTLLWSPWQQKDPPWPFLQGVPQKKTDISTVKELHLEFVVVKEPQLPMYKVTYRGYNSIYNYV